MPPTSDSPDAAVTYTGVQHGAFDGAGDTNTAGDADGPGRGVPVGDADGIAVKLVPPPHLQHITLALKSLSSYESQLSE